MKTMWWVGMSVVLLGPCSVAALTNELTWTANKETDLAGYKFYHFAGTTCPAGPLPPLMVDGKHVTLAKDVTKYIHIAKDVHGLWCYEITAYDTSGNESGRSNRATKTVDAKAPAPPVLTLGPARP